MQRHVARTYACRTIVKLTTMHARTDYAVAYTFSRPLLYYIQLTKSIAAKNDNVFG